MRSSEAFKENLFSAEKTFVLFSAESLFLLLNFAVSSEKIISRHSKEKFSAQLLRVDVFLRNTSSCIDPSQRAEKAIAPLAPHDRFCGEQEEAALS